ncbi:sorting nexin-4-like [Aulostomus maculatus]
MKGGQQNILDDRKHEEDASAWCLRAAELSGVNLPLATPDAFIRWKFAEVCGNDSSFDGATGGAGSSTQDQLVSTGQTTCSKSRVRNQDQHPVPSLKWHQGACGAVSPLWHSNGRMADDGMEDSAVTDGTADQIAAPRSSSFTNTALAGGSILARRLEICVAEAEKRSGKNAVNMLETFTVYLLETRPMDALAEGRGGAPDTLWRRYSEFELLRNYLIVSYPYVVVPPLPEKRAEFVWHKLSADNMDPDFVERRRVGLENFLLRVASHPVLSDDKILYHFLTEEHGWKEVVYDTGFQAKADSRLRALSATFRVRNPDKRFMEMKRYSDELQSHTSQLLRARVRVADRLYGVYKIHGNYGRVFSEWSAIEKEMGDGLQSAGHHMDGYAASIDDILEEEEHYADQLKEYLFYAEALRFGESRTSSSGSEASQCSRSWFLFRAVCRKHELTQYELETACQDLLSRKQQREELASGIVRTFSFKGMTNKLFGQEAPEQREARLKQLEELIAEGEDVVKEKTVECEEYVDKAWVDMQRFREQYVKDLREALISYALIQISMWSAGVDQRQRLFSEDVNVKPSRGRAQFLHLRLPLMEDEGQLLE